MTLPDLQNGESGALIRTKINNAIAALNALQIDFDSLDISWNEISDKPLTFEPEAHGHAISEIINLASALADKLAIANFTWANLPGKPGSLAPTVKTASESVLNSTTPQPDDILLFPVVAGKRYWVKLFIFGTKTGGVTRSLMVAISGAAAFGVWVGSVGSAATPNSQYVSDFTVDTQTGLSNSSVNWSVFLYLVVTATSTGTCNVNWAQAAINTTTPTVVTFAVMEVTEL